MPQHFGGWDNGLGRRSGDSTPFTNHFKSQDHVLLQCSVDPEDTSEFRILADGKHVKHLTIDPGLYAAEDMCFAPLETMLPPRHPETGTRATYRRRASPQLYPRCQDQTTYSTITHLWHPRHIDYLVVELRS